MKNTVDLNQFENYATQLISKYQIPGVAIGLAHNGSAVYEKGFGYRNIEKKLPVTMDTVFGIASVTKSFTCVAVMQLQDAGKLSVHDPVIKYLPEFSTPSDKTGKMTIHHFMTHTAGLPPLPSIFYAKKRCLELDSSVKDYPGLDFNNVNQEPIDTYEQLMEFIAGLEFELLGDPGTHFSYSNDSYALLGAIVERVSGMRFEKYVKDYILEPSGMLNTCGLIDELAHHDDITSLYAARKVEDGEEVYESPVWWESPSMKGAGYLKSTVRDMLKYAEIFRNAGKVGDKQILSKESVQEMIYPHFEIVPGKFYGYGLMITPNYHGATLIEHGGNLKAVASQLCIIPERGVTAMILTNLAGVPATTIMSGALNIFEGRPVNSSPEIYSEYELSTIEMEEYIGTFTSNEGMKIKITIKEETLELNTQEQNFPIQFIGNNLFVANVNDQEEVIRFIRNEQGEIERIAYHFRQFPKTIK